MNIFTAREDSLKILRLARGSSDWRLEPRSLSEEELLDVRLDYPLLQLALKPMIGGPAPGRPVSLRAFLPGLRSQSKLVRPCVGSLQYCDQGFLEVIKANGEPIASNEDVSVRLFVESAGLTFLEAARALDAHVRKGLLSKESALLRLMGFGMELCGTYARDAFEPFKADCSYGIEPIGDAAQVACGVANASGARGVVLAREAAQYLRNGLASPLEVQVLLGMCLPPRLGGAGLPEPLINTAASWPKGTVGLLNHQTMRPDYQWPAYSLACEADGWGPHSGRQAFTEDRNRQQDYGVCGITMIPVTQEDVATPAGLEGFLAKLVHCMAPFEGRAFEWRAQCALKDQDAHAARTLLVANLQPPVLGYD